jgi:hypothetical protein
MSVMNLLGEGCPSRKSNQVRWFDFSASSKSSTQNSNEIGISRECESRRYDGVGLRESAIIRSLGESMPRILIGILTPQIPREFPYLFLRLFESFVIGRGV